MRWSSSFGLVVASNYYYWWLLIAAHHSSIADSMAFNLSNIAKLFNCLKMKKKVITTQYVIGWRWCERIYCCGPHCVSTNTIFLLFSVFIVNQTNVKFITQTQTYIQNSIRNKRSLTIQYNLWCIWHSFFSILC